MNKESAEIVKMIVETYPYDVQIPDDYRNEDTRAFLHELLGPPLPLIDVTENPSAQQLDLLLQARWIEGYSWVYIKTEQDVLLLKMVWG